MCYHIFAFIAGFVLDLLIGDPHFIPHPVRLIGSLISFCDKRLNCDAGYNISEKKLNLIKYSNKKKKNLKTKIFKYCRKKIIFSV